MSPASPAPYAGMKSWTRADDAARTRATASGGCALVRAPGAAACAQYLHPPSAPCRQVLNSASHGHGNLCRSAEGLDSAA
eukprot:4776319-Pleurochrysis_carterae.AAC.1